MQKGGVGGSDTDVCSRCADSSPNEVTKKGLGVIFPGISHGTDLGLMCPGGDGRGLSRPQEDSQRQ